MNIFQLSLLHQIILFVLCAGYLQILWALICIQVPAEWFSTSKFPYKLYRWEKNGKIYSKNFLIRRWKKYLPDAAQYFKGEFKKKHLASTERSYIQTFIAESCRVEWAHWVAMISFVVFFVLLSWKLALAANTYAVAVNLPCIFAQRYNRPRLEQFLKHSDLIEARRSKIDLDKV